MQGVESDPISLKITVLKKLYEQWWFYPSIIILLGTLLVFGVRYYYKQQIREVELRNQISADLHDDIGASMSNIGILITLIRQRLGGNGETATLLNRVDEEVASSSEALDDIIWSINPINDSLDRVLARMRRFASEVFEAKDINGTIQFPQNMQGLRLGLEKRRQFYLLFKEAVNNLAKYAQCTEASIVVECHQGVLFLAVSDNGVGFNVEESMDKGNGLKTMAERARKLNAAFTIESNPGKGTYIQVMLPVTEKGD
jgi:signal transduction histidine kinase